MPKPSYEQQEVLCDFLEEHTQLARGRLYTQEARHKSGILWARIATTLNAKGNGAIKPAEGNKGWAKYWLDKKSYLKKVAGSKIDSDRGPLEDGKLSDLDKRFLNLIGHGVGHGNGTTINPLLSVEEEEKNNSVAHIHVTYMEMPEELPAVTPRCSSTVTQEQKAAEVHPQETPARPPTSATMNNKSPKKKHIKFGSRVMVQSRMVEERQWIRNVKRHRLLIEKKKLALEQRRLECEQRRLECEQERFRCERERFRCEQEQWRALREDMKNLTNAVKEKACTTCAASSVVTSYEAFGI